MLLDSGCDGAAEVGQLSSKKNLSNLWLIYVYSLGTLLTVLTDFCEVCDAIFDLSLIAAHFDQFYLAFALFLARFKSNIIKFVPFRSILDRFANLCFIIELNFQVAFYCCAL